MSILYSKRGTSRGQYRPTGGLAMLAIKVFRKKNHAESIPNGKNGAMKMATRATDNPKAMTHKRATREE